MGIKKKIGLALACIAVAAFLAFVYWPRRYEAVAFPMGGIPFKIAAYGVDHFEFNRLTGAVWEEVSRLSSVFDKHKGESELSRLNAAAATSPVKLSKDMFNVVSRSKFWFRKTRGAFDPACEPVLRLWKGANDEGRLPERRDLAAAILLSSLDDVRLEGDAISFAKEGMALDFGAIAKGYIVDRIASMMQGMGIQRGIVTSGGEVRAFGESEFQIGIQDPVDVSRIMGTLRMGEGGVSTSGDYRRYFVIGGVRYSHVVDPRTGMPEDSGVVSATVIGNEAADADAVATAVLVLGAGDGIKLIRGLEGYRAIIVEKKEGGFAVYASRSLDGALSLNGEWARDVRWF
jgi:thiamine biosynthesis lipoprotein